MKVTEKAFRERFDALLKVIEKKFGKFHPVAQYGRVGVEKGGN